MRSKIALDEAKSSSIHSEDPGTTLIASEKSHRQARLIEIDPSFVDVSIRRWQQLTGRNAVLAGTASSFREVECLRADEL
jgi:hypothetical protein